jgi:molybdate transport system substrate-binding protein
MRTLPLVMMSLAMVSSNAAELNVFAAASLTDALREIAASFDKQTGSRVNLNFGASSLLERQIEEGAPADVFVSADEAKMEELAQKGLIKPETRKDLLGNSLVVVVANDSRLTIEAPEDLLRPEIRKLALADPKAVPAGIYAQKFLERANLFEKLRARIIPTENVRAALAAVEAGNADAAVVYKTDAAISKRVRVAWSVPPGQAPPIVYPVAVLRETRQPQLAAGFVRFLQSPDARAIFTRFGFVVKN